MNVIHLFTRTQLTEFTHLSCHTELYHLRVILNDNKILKLTLNFFVALSFSNSLGCSLLPTATKDNAEVKKEQPFLCSDFI